jgi:hypothetical protein
LQKLAFAKPQSFEKIYNSALCCRPCLLGYGIKMAQTHISLMGHEGIIYGGQCTVHHQVGYQ